MEKENFNYVFECAWDSDGSLHKYFTYSQDKSVVVGCYDALVFYSPSMIYAQCKDVANNFVFLKYLR